MATKLEAAHAAERGRRFERTRIKGEKDMERGKRMEGKAAK